MNNVAVKLASILLFLLLPHSLFAQQVEAPVYQDGDWWKVKVEFKYVEGYADSYGVCHELYPEYLVKIEQGKPKVYGISGPIQEEIDCPQIVSEVLGKGPAMHLKFPLSINLSWSVRYLSEKVSSTGGAAGGSLGSWIDATYNVLAWEKVHTATRVFEAFKIRREIYDRRDSIFYYSPKVKSIVRLKQKTRSFKRTVTLVDFSLISGRIDPETPLAAKKPLETQKVAKPQRKQQTSTPPRPAAEVAVPSQPIRPRQVTQPPIPKREGKRFAVLIGIGDYKSPSIPDLSFATSDARSIYDLLTDPNRGGFPKENVKLILDRDATRLNIVDAIGDWLFRKAGPDDEVFVYYAGHGAVEKDRTGTEADGLAKYLVPADAVPQKLFVTGISNGELARMFQVLKTKRLVFFLDSCYSAGTTGLGRALTATGFRAGSLSSDLYGSLAGSGQAIIAAAKPNQVALELPKFSHGLFTKFVLDGLQGKADANGDGLVTLLELYPYLSKEVPRVARQEGAIQEPVLRSSISGDLVLSSVPETLQKLSIEARIGRLKKLYLEEAISVKQYDKAVQILESDQRNRILEDFLKGEMSLSTFRRSF